MGEAYRERVEKNKKAAAARIKKAKRRLSIIIKGGCEHSTYGIGWCLKRDSGMKEGAKYWAEAVCNSCLAWAALKALNKGDK